MFRFEKVSKYFGAQAILAEAELAIHSGERVGLIGPNGVGKTTVLRMMAGEIEVDSGEIVLVGRPRIGVLRQELTETASTILQETLAGHQELTLLRQQRDQLRKKMEEESGADQVIHQLGEIECRLETLGTYDAEARAGAILQGLGFSPDALQQPVSAFSGGWRMRVALAQALFAAPDLLLLDEPTNHLDLESVAWLEGFLAQWRGGLVLISHNRNFLNRTVQVIVELMEGRLTRYVGNFDQYLEQKAANLEVERKTAVQQQLRIDHLECFIRRFRAKATKARQVQSRIKALDKMERVEVSTVNRPPPVMRLPPPTPCQRQVLIARNLVYGYGGEDVFKGATFSLNRGDKVGLLGVNGSGKSTLLKLCAGFLTGMTGQFTLGDRVKPAYFAQHSLESLDASHTVLQSVQVAALEGPSGLDVRTLLGGFLFSGDEVFKPVSVLSGGERARLALARLFVTGANLLLLDEPTNHLDMGARAALADALESYAGTLVMVSHDQDLLESVCDNFWLIGGGGAVVWEGGLDNYLAECSQRRSGAVATVASGVSRRDVRRLSAEMREEANRTLRPLRSRCAKLEERIQVLEEEQRLLDEFLADGEAYAEINRHRLAVSLERNGFLAAELEGAMAEWEQVSQEIDERERTIREQTKALTA